MNGLYPWMNQADLTNTGFRDQMLNDNITGIRDGITGISTQLCNGFSSVQMSGMQNAFGLQNAINAGFNGTQAQLAQMVGTSAPYVSRLINKKEGIINKVFVEMLDKLGYDIRLIYVKKKSGGDVL